MQHLCFLPSWMDYNGLERVVVGDFVQVSCVIQAGWNAFSFSWTFPAVRGVLARRRPCSPDICAVDVAPRQTFQRMRLCVQLLLKHGATGPSSINTVKHKVPQPNKVEKEDNKADCVVGVEHPFQMMKAGSNNQRQQSKPASSAASKEEPTCKYCSGQFDATAKQAESATHKRGVHNVRSHDDLPAHK